jgi:hypothetical protein
MIIRISVHITAEPQDSAHGSYGSMNFDEEAHMQQGNFDLVSKVFTRCHDLLETLRAEYPQNKQKGQMSHFLQEVKTTS